MLDLFFITIAGFIGGLIYRMRGGYGPSLPRPIEQMLFCFVFLLPLSFLPWEWILIPYVLSVIATLKGHGRNMDLGHSYKPNSEVSPEWYEFTIKWLEGKISEYWYDVIGIAVSGLTVTLPIGVFLAAFGYISLGVYIGLLGASKGLAYMIGWWLHPNYNDGPKTFLTKSSTEWGEFLFGFFVWGGVFMVMA